MNIIQGSVDCTPREAGYDPSRLDAINAFFTRMIEQKSIYGASYRLARHGKTFAAAALGRGHYKKDVPMQPDTVFGIWSITKSFAAVAVQILVEDGLLAIEDKVAKYLPQFDGPPYDKITLFHLLTHTSGLYPEEGMPDKHHQNWYGCVADEYEKHGADMDWVSAGLRGGVRLEPGREWQYCNFGFQAIGEIIRVASGMTASEFIETRICKPLGMNDTGFNATPDMARRALIFDEWGEEWTGRILRGEPIHDGMWDILPGTAGSMMSTTADIMRFGVMLQQNGRLGDARILGRKAIESMTTQRLFGIPDYSWGGNVPERYYGLGLDMRYIIGALPSPETFFHEGSGASIVIIDPREGLVGSWVIPWVGGWDNDCSRRIINVVWSGIM